MATRTFGAINGAGVQVQEVQPAKPIQDGPLGSTIMVGVFRSGPTDRVISLESGLPQYRRVFGGLAQYSDAPLCAEHFYSAGRGAGVLHVLRVTDGTERAASLALYNRDVDLNVCEGTPPTKLPAVVMTLDADNGGRWGGRRAVKAGDVTLSTAITGDSTVDLGITSELEDEWVGATLRFPNDDSSFEGVITSNTAAGVFTIAGTFPEDLSAGTDGRWTLELLNEHELTGALEALAVEVGDGGRDPSLQFSLYVYRDGVKAKEWADLAMDAAGDAYWFDAIDGDLDNYEIEPQADDFSGDPAASLQRPANYAEIPAPGGVGTNTLTFQVVRWARSGTGTPFLDTINDITWGSDPREVTILLTFTAATTFTVAATFPDGKTVTSLPTGTLGTAYTSQHAWLPGFTARAGTVAAIAGTTLTIYVRPLPADLQKKGAYLYIAAAPSEGDTRTKYRVASNDHETVTLAPSVDLTGEVDAPGAPSFTGTVSSATFDMSSGSLTFIYSVGLAGALKGPFTLTESLSGAAETIAAVVADLNARELARVSGVAADKLVEFTATSDNKVKVTALQDFGPDATITLGSGTLNAVLGYTNSASTTGSAPTICRLQFRQELGGGYDGRAAVDGDTYVSALDVSTSPLNDLLESNTGLLRIAAPGTVDVDAQVAVMRWAHATNSLAYVEIPDTYTTEAGAIAWHETNLAIGAEQDYAACHWPSYGDIVSPYGSGLYRAPLTGLILGAEARFALESKGYHLAPAGDGLTLPGIKRLPTLDRRLDNEALNSYGLIEVRKRGAVVKLWGDRLAGYGGRPWKHKRAANSHIGRVLLTNTTSLVFRAINASSLAEAKRLVRELFLSWYRVGWFDDTAGATFEKQVEIKADASNNPAAERALGNLHVDIAFTIVDTAERVIFKIGPAGIEETS